MSLHEYHKGMAPRSGGGARGSKRVVYEHPRVVHNHTCTRQQDERRIRSLFVVAISTVDIETTPMPSQAAGT